MKKPEPGWVRLAFLGVALLLLSSCGPVSVGPFTYAPPARNAHPALYADPGVRIIRGDKGPIAYQAGMDIFVGDTIETGDGFAVLDMGEDNVVTLNRRTRIQLGSIKLFFGEIFSRISRITGRGSGQVLTNEVSASVEGTEYAVRREVASRRGAPGVSQVIVRRGKVRCEPATGSAWSAITLGENYSLRIDGLRVGKALRVDAQAETRWADEAEMRLLPAAPQSSFDFGIMLPTTASHGNGTPSSPTSPSAPPTSDPASSSTGTGAGVLRDRAIRTYPTETPIIK
jgi:hypothetical protein